MNFKFHHMNLCSDNLGRLTNFYQTMFNLGAINDGRTRVNDKSMEVGYNGKVDFVSDGAIEFHLAGRDLLTGFKMKQFINPMHHGHFCFRTDDIIGFKRRLDELGIRYSDYGIWAVAGWYQIFLHDPDGNIVEVHQPTCGSQPRGRHCSRPGRVARRVVFRPDCSSAPGRRTSGVPRDAHRSG